MEVVALGILPRLESDATGYRARCAGSRAGVYGKRAAGAGMGFLKFGLLPPRAGKNRPELCFLSGPESGKGQDQIWADEIYRRYRESLAGNQKERAVQPAGKGNNLVGRIISI